MIDLSPASYRQQRYTFDGDAAAEIRMASDQDEVVEAVLEAVPARFLEAIVLIGGYGRGDGGYVETAAGGVAPFNDYDYFLVFKDCSPAQAKRLCAGIDCHQLERRTGVEVDFFPLMTAELAHLEYSLMYAEMQQGHRVIYGNPDVLGEMEAMPLDGVSTAEFRRLMVNRGFLLLLNYSTPDPEKFSLYINKAILAVGDSLLHEWGEYHLSLRHRLACLMERSEDEALKHFYLEAVKAKYRPDLARVWTRRELLEVTEIWLGRMQTINAAEVKATVKPLQMFKNLLLNLSQPLLRPRLDRWIRHPREYLGDCLLDQLQDKAEGMGRQSDADLIQLWHRFA